MRGPLFRTFDTLLDKTVVLSYTRLGYALRQAAWKGADLEVDMAGQMILTELWAEKLAGSGGTVNAMHPGWADTPGVQKSLPTFRRLIKRSLRTPEQGADTILWLAVAGSVADKTGKFWFDRRERGTHLLPGAQGSACDRQHLWNDCVRLSGLADQAIQNAEK